MGAKKFAAFDLDGTVFRFALFHSIVEHLAAEKLYSEEAVQAIEGGKQSWKNRSHPDAFWDYVKPSVEAFENNLTKLSVSQHLKAVDAVFEAQKNHVYTYTRDLLKDLHGKGYFLLAISGSQAEIVEKFANYYGFDDWVGSEYEHKDGKYTGRIIGAHKDKHLIIERLVSKHKLTFTDSVAVGDTHRDISMLEMVENPIAFNPNQELLDHARKNSWKVVVERKNVVYELKPNSGHYQLL